MQNAKETKRAHREKCVFGTPFWFHVNVSKHGMQIPYAS